MLHAKLEFEVEDKAGVLSKALSPDSLEWCRCFDRNGRFFIKIRTEKIGTLLYTVDDYLMNIKVALEILNLLDGLK